MLPAYSQGFVDHAIWISFSYGTESDISLFIDFLILFVRIVISCNCMYLFFSLLILVFIPLPFRRRHL